MGHRLYQRRHQGAGLFDHQNEQARRRLSLFSHSITIYARATRTVLNHVPVGESRARFHPQEPVTCPRGKSDLDTTTHIVTECPRFTVTLFSYHPECPHNRSQTGQRHWERTPHLVPSLRTQALTYGVPSVLTLYPATYLTSSPVLPLFCFSLVLCLSLSYDLICIFIRGTEPP